MWTTRKYKAQTILSSKDINNHLPSYEPVRLSCIISYLLHPPFLPILHPLSILPSDSILPPKPKPTIHKVSYLRENAPPFPSTYTATLQNHQLYQRELGTLEAHRARHNARTNLFHEDNKYLAREAWKD